MKGKTIAGQRVEFPSLPLNGDTLKVTIEPQLLANVVKVLLSDGEYEGS